MLDLFGVAPSKLRTYMEDLGYLPWGDDPDINISLARPLTALSHMLDYALWPDLPAIQHLHSLLWFALGVGMVAALYRRAHASALAAGLAALMFAVEDAHSLVAGWVANRNALLCLVFGVAMVHAHLRWRERRSPGFGVAALVLLILGLLSGEATLGAVAYVVAWQLTREEGSWRKRLLPVVPYALVIVTWRVVYNILEYGAKGSSLYIDPGEQPLRFAGALAERLPLLVAGQWLQVPIDVWLMLSPGEQIVASLLAAGLACLLAWLMWSVLRADALARFWALGMVLALVPLCAAFPMDRLLMFAGIGAFGLLAALVQSVGAWPWPKSPASGWRKRSAVALLVIHVPIAALLLVARVATLPALGAILGATAEQAPSGPEVAGQSFIFVNGNDFPVAYTHVIRVATDRLQAPLRVVQLSPASTSNTVARPDERTLVVTAEGGFYARAIDRLLISPERRFAVGERITRPDFVAEIRAVTADSRPLEVAFVFRCPLEDPSLRWLCFDARKGLREFTLPAVGATMVMAGSKPSVGFVFGQRPRGVEQPK
jgi:hypothetical protein